MEHRQNRTRQTYLFVVDDSDARVAQVKPDWGEVVGEDVYGALEPRHVLGQRPQAELQLVAVTNTPDGRLCVIVC